MQVKFFTIAKKTNSTYVPGGGVEFEVRLKSPCGVLNPVLEMSSDIKGYNYVYIPDFGRYYFINAVGYSGGLWFASCEVDVLASYRSQILNSSEYVLRSSSTYNGAIVDGFYPVTADMSTSLSELSDSSNPFTLAGVFCVGVSGAGSALGISYYLFTPSNFRLFVDALLGNAFIDGNPFVLTDSEGDTTLGDGIIKSLVNPMQYITTCFFIPMSQSVLMELGSTETRVQIGAWDTLGVTCKKLTGVTTAIFTDYNLIIPKHPQSSRGLYLNGAPFSNYRFLVEPFGMFELPSTELAEAEKIYFDFTVDVTTGLAGLDVYMQSNKLYKVAHKTAQIGIPISITQVAQNILGAGASIGANIIAGATNFAAGNLVGLAANASGAIMSAINGLMPTVTSNGATGSFLTVEYKPQLHARFANIAPEDNIHNGRPVCMEKTLNTLSGLCICDKPTLEISGALKDEVNQIERFMEAGFFIE